MLFSPSGVVVDKDGNYYIHDSGNSRIRKVTVPKHSVHYSLSSPFNSSKPYAIDEVSFNDPDGKTYKFDGSGNHRATLDSITDTTVTLFNHVNGRLISISDKDHLTTVTIERNANGIPTRIVSPDGYVTNLTVNARGELACVSYGDPDNHPTSYTLT
jgi:hypothetical protein